MIPILYLTVFMFLLCYGANVMSSHFFSDIEDMRHFIFPGGNEDCTYAIAGS